MNEDIFRFCSDPMEHFDNVLNISLKEASSQREHLLKHCVDKSNYLEKMIISHSYATLFFQHIIFILLVLIAAWTIRDKILLAYSVILFYIAFLILSLLVMYVIHRHRSKVSYGRYWQTVARLLIRSYEKDKKSLNELQYGLKASISYLKSSLKFYLYVVSGFFSLIPALSAFSLFKSLISHIYSMPGYQYAVIFYFILAGCFLFFKYFTPLHWRNILTLYVDRQMAIDESLRGDKPQCRKF